MANKDKGGSKSSKTAGEQVAEGEAPGEEGESHSFGRILDGNLDQQVARGVNGPTRGGLPLRPSSMPGRCGRSRSWVRSGSAVRRPTGPGS